MSLGGTVLAIQRGFRGKLGDYLDPNKELIVEISVSGPSTYDYACFGVDANDKLSDDRYMIFFNQTSSPNDEIVLSQQAGLASYRIGLSHLPASINKFVFTASTDSSGNNINGSGTMKSISSFSVKIKQGNNVALQLDMTGRDFQSEKAIIAVEIYAHQVSTGEKVEWRVSSVASGFNGGLSDLLKSYGGEEFSVSAPPPPPKPSGTVNLSKGQKVDLTKADGGVLKQVVVGLGWDVARGGPDIDCDASAILCGLNGKMTGGNDLVYFGNKKHSSGSVWSTGDNLTGAGEDDDEQLIVKLSSVPANYGKIVFVVNLYEAASRRQHFGMIQNAFIRIVDSDTGKELMKYNLSEKYDHMTAMIFGEMTRENGQWQFKALGDATKDGNIHTLAARYK
jgi:stress response protein SCP2